MISKEQIIKFHKQGYLGPLRLSSINRIDEIRQHVIEELLFPNTQSVNQSKKPEEGSSIDRHQDCAIVSDLCTDDKITDCMSKLYGNILLMHQKFWCKCPGDGKIPWHQDGHVYGNHPSVTISAWIALNETSKENGCIELIPNSHLGQYIHTTSNDNGLFKTDRNVAFDMKVRDKEIQDLVDDHGTIKMEMKPGEFFLFTGSTVHRSTSNTTNSRRLGMSIHCTLPQVNFMPERDIKDDHNLMMISGQDKFQINDVISHPDVCSH